MRFGYVMENGKLTHRRKGQEDRTIPDDHHFAIRFDGVQGSGKSLLMRAIRTVFASEHIAIVDDPVTHEMRIIHAGGPLFVEAIKEQIG